MPSTYTVNLGIEKPATGEQSGTWGDTTNVNFDILDQAINGAARVTLSSAGSSGSPNALIITNGAASDGRNKWIEFYSSGDLGGDVFVQLQPNDAEKIVFIRNSLAGSRSVLLFQGTYNSGRDLEISAGVDMVVKFDGGGASAANVTDVYNNLKVTGLVAGTADINGGTVDGTVIGGASAAALTATTVVANTSLNIAGDGATVTGIKDEDNMASNSATKLATQQSIKAYVDSQVGTVDTLAEILANGNETGSNDIDVDGAQKVAFRDAAIYIHSSTDGQLDIVADTEIQIAATTIDINGAIVASGDIAAASLDISGNVDIDGTLNVDAIDIDGAVQLDATLTVGVDDTGYDVKFYGATGGAYMLWDESADDLILAGAAGLVVAGNVDFNGDLDVDGTTNLDVVDIDGATHISGAITSTETIRQTNNANTSSHNILVATTNKDSNLMAYGVDRNGTVTGIQVDGSIVAPSLDISGDIDVDGTTNLDIVDIDGALTQDGGAVFNEASADVDFRVESDSNTNMLFVDGGANHVNIGTATDLQGVLNVDGNVSLSGNGTGNRAIALLNETDAYEGSLIIQAGGVSAAYGAGIRLYGHSHASKPGDVVAGISSGSGGSFRVNSAGVDTGTDRLEVTAGGSIVVTPGAGADAVFNEGGVDADFRVESDTITHALFVDGANGYIGINDSSPSAQLDLNTSSGLMTILNSTHTNGGYVRFEKSGTVYGDLGNGAQIVSGGATTAFGMNTRGTGDLLLATNGVTRASIQNGGAFTTNPLAGGHAVFNESGVDADFRVESDGNANMLFVDGGGDTVIIGASSASNSSQHLAVHGNTGLGNRLTSSSGGGYVTEISGTSLTTDGSNWYGSYGVLNFYVTASYTGSARRWTLTNGYRTNRFAFLVGDTDASSQPELDGNGGQASNAFSPLWFDSETGAATFNDDSKDADFRVESNDNANMLFVDASTNRVGIGSSSPNKNVEILASNATLRLEDTASGSKRLDIGVLDTAVAFVDAPQSAQTLKMSVSGTESLTQYHNVNGSVFNEGSADRDFRVESDAYTNALYVDAGSNYVELQTPTIYMGEVKTQRVYFNVSANTNRRIRLSLANYASVRVKVAALRTNSGNSFVYWDGYVNENDNTGYDHPLDVRASGGTISFTFTNNDDGSYDWDFNNQGSPGNGTITVEQVTGSVQDVTVTTY